MGANRCNLLSVSDRRQHKYSAAVLTQKGSGTLSLCILCWPQWLSLSIECSGSQMLGLPGLDHKKSWQFLLRPHGTLTLGTLPPGTETQKCRKVKVPGTAMCHAPISNLSYALSRRSILIANHMTAPLWEARPLEPSNDSIPSFLLRTQDIARES